MITNFFSKPTKFPAKTRKEAEQFTRIVRVLSLLEDNLKRNYTATRRDVFYQDVELFRVQSKVDLIVEAICRVMETSGDQIGAVASQKGLMLGSVTMTLISGETKIIHSSNGEPILVPRLLDVDSVEPTEQIEYILVVEKEAVFNAFIKSSTSTHPRIIITARGFPDVLTRMFLHKLSESCPDVPVYGFADFDPSGWHILQCYRTGGPQRSINTMQQSCPRLQLTSASILDFYKKSNCSLLSHRDFQSCRNILLKWSHQHLTGKWGTEIQRMMFFGKKAELDAIKSIKQENQQVEIVEYIESHLQHSL